MSANPNAQQPNEGFDPDEDITFAASSDALSRIREQAAKLRSGANAPGDDAPADDASGDDDSFGDDPTISGSAGDDDSFGDDPTTGALGDDLTTGAADGDGALGDDLTVPRAVASTSKVEDEPKSMASTFADELTTPLPADTLARIRSTPAVREPAPPKPPRVQAPLPASGSLIEGQDPPASTVSYFAPDDSPFADRDTGSRVKRRFPRWLIVAALVGAAIIVAMAIGIAVASAQGI